MIGTLRAEDAAIGGDPMDQHHEVEHDTDPSASRSCEATRNGAQAFARLLQLAEQRSSGQIVRVAAFIAATYNGEAFKLDPFELRAVDIAISDDMLLCLDAPSLGQYRPLPAGSRWRPPRQGRDPALGLSLARRGVTTRQRWIHT